MHNGTVLLNLSGCVPYLVHPATGYLYWFVWDDIVAYHT